MAIYRKIQMTFWTDSKVVDAFTPEDKYFYLYLMTNPHTNLCGCYEVSTKQISDETGYTKETVERLIDRMENTHEVIRYSKNTKEILILNWFKYNWTKSCDFQKPLLKEIDNVKNPDFKTFLENTIDSLGIVIGQCRESPGIVLGQCGESPETTVTDTDNNNEFNNLFKMIIDYLNIKANTRYKYTSDKYKKAVHARVNEGFTVDDFMLVIDKKCEEWIGTEWEKFLRPETLFGTKFESYLNQKIDKPKKVDKQCSLDEWVARKEREENERK